MFISIDLKGCTTTNLRDDDGTYNEQGRKGLEEI